jgi:hypothetical protein
MMNGDDLEGSGRVLFQGTLSVCVEGLKNNTNKSG